MNKQEFLAEIDEILEQPAGSLDGSEELAALEAWDSLAVIGFIAMLDEKYQVNIAASKIKETITVNALFELVRDRV